MCEKSQYAGKNRMQEKSVCRKMIEPTLKIKIPTLTQRGLRRHQIPRAAVLAASREWHTGTLQGQTVTDLRTPLSAHLIVGKSIRLHLCYVAEVMDDRATDWAAGR